MFKITRPQENAQRDIKSHILEWKLKEKKTRQNKTEIKQLTGIDKDVEKLEYW